MTSNMRCFFVFCFACIDIVCALANAFISVDVLVVVVFFVFLWGGGATLFYYNMSLRCITVTYFF